MVFAGPRRNGARLRAWAVLGLSLLASGCATSRHSYNAAEAASASVGSALTRTWGDVPSAAFDREVNRRFAQAGHDPSFLALSGGGGDGAYGAGLLNGWTRSGRRPKFVGVSGVSTGALMAPFAFLGPAYDATLTEIYTSGVAESLLQSPNLVQALVGSSIFSNDKLNELVARYITPEIVAAVGREGERGRVLLVLTTNLDSQRPVVWNMTEIARGGTPEAVALFRTVLVASSSVPAVFPPVLIGADANGRRIEELHVDGSVSSNVFTLPRSYLLGNAKPRVRGAHLYILLNTKLLPSFTVVQDKTTSLVSRVIETTNKDETRTDLSLVQQAARRDGLDFNLTYIEGQEAGADPFGFDTVYMRRLYGRGEQIGQTGTFWKKSPPPLGSQNDDIVVSR